MHEYVIKSVHKILHCSIYRVGKNGLFQVSNDIDLARVFFGVPFFPQKVYMTFPAQQKFPQKINFLLCLGVQLQLTPINSAKNSFLHYE